MNLFINSSMSARDFWHSALTAAAVLNPQVLGLSSPTGLPGCQPLGLIWCCMAELFGKVQGWIQKETHAMLKVKGQELAWRLFLCSDPHSSHLYTSCGSQKNWKILLSQLSPENHRHPQAFTINNVSIPFFFYELAALKKNPSTTLCFLWIIPH